MSAVALVLPLVLALVAEAAWIAVLAGLLDAFAHHDPGTGVLELFVAAVVGLGAARTLGPRLGDRWSLVAVVLAAGAGAIGWLGSPEVRGLLAANGTDALGAALVANPGGLLLALAFVRGMAHARLPVDAERLGMLLAVGIPGLAVVAIVGGMAAEPWRSAFLATAELQVLLFLASAIAALALARLTEIGRGVRIDWRRNPAWLALLRALVGATAAAALWVAGSVGTTIATAAAAVLVPLLAAGFVAGFDRRSVRILASSVLAVGVLAIVVRVLSAPGGPLPPSVLAPQDIPQGDPQAQTSIALGALGIALTLAVIALMVLARLWLRRSREEPALDDEERTIDHGAELEGSRPGRRRFRQGRGRMRPTDAVSAYLALIAALEGRPPVARGAGETPAEHARRLRSLGHGTFALDLLAADVGLSRFGSIE